MKSLALILSLIAIAACGQATPSPFPAHSTNLVEIPFMFIHELLNEARTNHPSLKAADSRIRSATLHAESIRTWEDPMAMLGGTLYGSKGFTASEDGDLSYGVGQKLPVWNKPKLARKLADTETSARQAEADLRLQELRREIARSLIGAALAQRVVELGEQDLS